MAANATQPTDIIVGGKRVRLAQNMYVAAGGEATIYKHNGVALRLYHDIAAMPPKARLDELSRIKQANVVRPIDIIQDGKTGKDIGFSMAFVTDTEVLCQFFTAAFKKANNLQPATIGKLVVDIQDTVRNLIAEGFLPVDLNEMNILASMKDFTPWFIDIASWATPSFPATAIMENVRDPAVKGNAFTPGSTWYSFAIIAAQLYLGIHPFHGVHPTMKMDWKKRMAANASIFQPGVRVPPVVPPFSVVPSRHLDWMKKIFADSSFREAPPHPDAMVPQTVTPTAARVINATGNFQVKHVVKAPYPIVDVVVGFGKTYIVTNESIYWQSGEHLVPIYNRAKYRKAYVIPISAEDVVIALVNTGRVQFVRYGHNGVGSSLLEDCELTGNIFPRNGRFYTANRLQFIEHDFMKLGAKLSHMETHVDNVNALTVRLFDGVAYQDFFGKAWLVVPFQAGATVSTGVPQLDGYRIIDAKMMGRICAVIGERGGAFSQFIITFNDGFTSVDNVRITPDQREINFTLTPQGVCVMLVGDTLELFRDPTKARVLNDPPIDGSTKLLSLPDGVHFIDGNEVQKLSIQ